MFTALTLTLWALAWAGNSIVDFQARRESQTIVLDWSIEQESGLKQFNIHRKIDQSNWIVIGTVTAKGLQSTRTDYQYRDSNIYKASLANCYYRLELEMTDGSKTIHSVIASASGMSGIRHTWGSLKAMFR